MIKLKSMKYKKKTCNLYCVNCGKTNHTYTNCNDPLNSYGILCFYNTENVNKTPLPLKKVINCGYNENNILLIFVNCKIDILQSLNNVQCIKDHYINDRKGFSIYYINNK